MIKFHKIKSASFAAAMVAMVFAQIDDAEKTEKFSEKQTQKENERKVKFRASGDLTLSPYWQIEGAWTKDGYKSKERFGRDSKFLAEYNYNAMLGLDVNDKLSFDVRLSNPKGYEFDLLPFADATAKNWNPHNQDNQYNEKEPKNYLPTIPNAYFTWNVNDVFSLKGGLLEVKKNTALDIVAGYEYGIRNRIGDGDWDEYEEPIKLYTSDANWETIYNNSQAGVKLEFDISYMFALNFTAAFPTNENTGGSDWRLILDADIGLGIVTLSPIFHTRIFHSNYYDENKEKDKNSLLWAYGLDALFEFSDAFGFEFGIAAGQIVEDKQVSGAYSYKDSESGVLLKAAPYFNFGINEATLSYSFGFGRDRQKTETGPDYEKYTYCATYSDLAASWRFRLNDYIALGPVFGWVSDSYKFKYDVKENGESEKGNSDYKSGNNTVRFGLEFVANF